MNTEFQFELTKPIKYHAGGEEIEGKFITLAPPAYKQMDKCVPLKQAFYRAAASISDDDSVEVVGETSPPAEAEKMTPEGLMSLFYQSAENMLQVMLYGVELFKSPGIAKLEGSVTMTHPMIEQMSQDDLENMLGLYMVNFILASALSKPESK